MISREVDAQKSKSAAHMWSSEHTCFLKMVQRRTYSNTVALLHAPSFGSWQHAEEKAHVNLDVSMVPLSITT